MTESFSLWSYGLWLANAVLELVILRAWFDRRSLPHLTLLPTFVGFLLFSDIGCYAIRVTGAFGPYGYAYGYWWSQVMESLLRSLLAIQILSHVLPTHKHKVTLWSCYAAFWIVAVFALGLPTDVTRVFIRMIVVADIIGGLLIGAAILIPSIHWPTGYTTAGFGLFLSFASDIGLYLLRFNTGTKYTTELRVFLPLASILALLMFFSATMAGQRQEGELSRGHAAAI